MALGLLAAGLWGAKKLSDREEARAAAEQQETNVADARALGQMMRAQGAETTPGAGMAVADMLRSSYGAEGAGQLGQALVERQREGEVAQNTAANTLLGYEQAGVDTRQVPGLFEALQQNPAQTMARMAQQAPNLPLNEIGIQQQAQQIQSAAQALGQKQAAYRELGQAVGLVQDMRTIYDEVGTESLPTAAAGAMKAIRFRMLNRIRAATDAGALQKEEIKLFNEIIPEGDTWFNLSQGEKYARLNQLEYWFEQKLENEIIARGDDLAISRDYTNFGREYDAILGDVPANTEEGLSLEERQREARKQPTIPGTSIPMPSFGAGAFVPRD